MPKKSTQIINLRSLFATPMIRDRIRTIMVYNNTNKPPDYYYRTSWEYDVPLGKRTLWFAPFRMYNTPKIRGSAIFDIDVLDGKIFLRIPSATENINGLYIGEFINISQYISHGFFLTENDLKNFYLVFEYVAQKEPNKTVGQIIKTAKAVLKKIKTGQ